MGKSFPEGARASFHYFSNLCEGVVRDMLKCIQRLAEEVSGRTRTIRVSDVKLQLGRMLDSQGEMNCITSHTSIPRYRRTLSVAICLLAGTKATSALKLGVDFLLLNYSVCAMMRYGVASGLTKDVAISLYWRTKARRWWLDT